MKIFFPLILSILCVHILGCSTSPTGRKQLILMPDGQMNSMGVQAFDEMKKKQTVETDPKIVNYVRCVAMPIAKEATDKTGVKDWEVQVFREDSANAFALPGGKIGVLTGLLKVAKTQGQLAAVLGHEVGHVIARHGNERVSQNVATQGGLVAASVATKDSEHRDLILAGLGVGAQFGVLLPYSRTHESEADIIGLKLMSQAGFDPREAVELWKNMAAASGGKAPPQFMSTHPSNETRIRNLSEGLPEAMKIFEQAQAQGKKPTC